MHLALKTYGTDNFMCASKSSYEVSVVLLTLDGDDRKARVGHRRPRCGAGRSDSPEYNGGRLAVNGWG